jgi:signal transduction histidine kinase
LTRTIEKRLSLHKNLSEQQEQIDGLKSQISRLQGLAVLGTATCMVAHEINNLLTPLGSYAELALKNPDDKQLIKKALQKTVKNCGHSSKIIESILSVTNGKRQGRKNSLLITLVEEVFSCLCRDFSKDGITVKIQIPKDLKVWIVAVQIQQVLMNLILNAREAMLPGGGTLSVKAEEKSETVEIEVSDTGCGIEVDDLEKVFEPFFTTKIDKKSALQKSGSGLGLMFCKRIIDEHNGCISVESKQGEGSTFTIMLPKKQ